MSDVKKEKRNRNTTCGRTCHYHHSRSARRANKCHSRRKETSRRRKRKSPPSGTSKKTFHPPMSLLFAHLSMSFRKSRLTNMWSSGISRRRDVSRRQSKRCWNYLIVSYGLTLVCTCIHICMYVNVCTICIYGLSDRWDASHRLSLSPGPWLVSAPSQYQLLPFFNKCICKQTMLLISSPPTMSSPSAQ